MDVQTQLIARNARVEADKAWETSKTRRGMIALLTYFVAFLYMRSLGVPDSGLSALIPTGGYLLSTLSLSYLKRYWLANFYRLKEPS